SQANQHTDKDEPDVHLKLPEEPTEERGHHSACENCRSTSREERCESLCNFYSRLQPAPLCLYLRFCSSQRFHSSIQIRWFAHDAPSPLEISRRLHRYATIG